MKNPPYDIVCGIIAWESGELDLDQTVELFRHLHATGTLWSIQGCYQRAYADLMNAGLL